MVQSSEWYSLARFGVAEHESCIAQLHRRDGEVFACVPRGCGHIEAVQKKDRGGRSSPAVRLILLYFAIHHEPRQGGPLLHRHLGGSGGKMSLSMYGTLIRIERDVVLEI